MNGLDSLRCVLCAAGAALLAAGCATPAPEAVAQGGQVVCRQEARTGSLRPTTSCRTAEDIRRDEEDANRTLSAPRPTVSGTGGTGR